MGELEQQFRDQLDGLREEIWKGRTPPVRGIDYDLERKLLESETVTFLVHWITRLAADVDELREAVSRGNDGPEGPV